MNIRGEQAYFVKISNMKHKNFNVRENRQIPYYWNTHVY